MAMPSEYDDIALPPIYESSMIITQPLRNELSGNNAFFSEQQNDRIPMNVDNNEQGNENVPISINWMSATRGFQTLPISPEYLLTNIEQLEIQPVVDVLANTTSKQYRVRCQERSETIFLATENSSEWQSKILGSMRHFSLILRDASGATAFTLTKSISSGCVPGFLHRMTINTPTELIGIVEQDFTWLGVNYSIREGVNNECVAYITGPIMFCCCCTWKNANFQVLSSNRRTIIGSIMHQWDYLRLDYILVVTFASNNMSERLKSLILGAAFLVESLYFDR